MNKPSRLPNGRFAKPKPLETVTVGNTVADIFWMVQELKRDLKAMRGEIGERLRVIEGDIEAMQKVIGVLAKKPEKPKIKHTHFWAVDSEDAQCVWCALPKKFASQGTKSL